MAGRNDATIKLLYPVDNGTFFSLDTVAPNTAFEVVADIEIGSNIMQVVTRHDVRVTVRNLSTGEVTTESFGELLANSLAPYNAPLKVAFPNGVKGSDGDVLEAVASYRATAGINTDYSTAASGAFILTT
jgi:hypothetical protein